MKIATKCKHKGYLENDTVPHLSVEEVTKIHPFGHFLWGSNSRGKATRARQVLGWRPKGDTLESTLDEAIQVEARALALTI